MLTGSVAWSSYDPRERASSNEDPLGVYAFAMRLAEEWLPGITTRTRRLRYYSMVCGGLSLIEEELGDRLREAENRDAERARLFMLWERLWVIGNVATRGSNLTGLIGRRKTESLFKGDDFSSRRLDYVMIKRQPDLGALGSYRTSLQNFELLRPDATELKVSGQRLAENFWACEGRRSLRGPCAEALESGLMRLPRSIGKLAPWGRRVGVDTRSVRREAAMPFEAERGLLAARLLPEAGRAARRTEVFQFLRARKLADMEEQAALRVAARGARRRAGGTDLERRAAAILAFERYRAALFSALELFRVHLFGKGSAAAPAALARSPELRRLLVEARAARQVLLRYADSAQFAQVFDGFALGRELDLGDGVSFLRGLLAVHTEEMERRRSPRWFHPCGRDSWELDASVAFAANDGDAASHYSYRTANLVTLATEAGRRL